MLWALENLQGLLKRYLKGWWKPNKLLPVDCLCFEHWTDNSSINMFRILLSFLHFNDKKKTTSGFFFLQNATQKLWNPSLNWFVPEIISKIFSSKILKKKNCILPSIPILRWIVYHRALPSNTSHAAPIWIQCIFWGTDQFNETSP